MSSTESKQVCIFLRDEHLNTQTSAFCTKCKTELEHSTVGNREGSPQMSALSV